ncbi:MAG: integrase core domain-containing protein [Solirubrobacteraceae bacterium]
MSGSLPGCGRSLASIPGGGGRPLTREAKVAIEDWRQEYNNYRPHSALGGRCPSEYATLTNQTTNNTHSAWTPHRGPISTTGTPLQSIEMDTTSDLKSSHLLRIVRVGRGWQCPSSLTRLAESSGAVCQRSSILSALLQCFPNV